MAPLITEIAGEEFDQKFYPLLDFMPKEIGLLVEEAVNAFVDRVATLTYIVGYDHGHEGLPCGNRETVDTTPCSVV